MAINAPQPYREATFPFTSQDIVTKLDAALLAEVQYKQLLNVESIQEGALRSRNGYRNLTPSGLTGAYGPLSYIHTIRRIGSGTQNPYYDIIYLGESDAVYRINGSIPPILIPSTDTGQQFACELDTRPDEQQWSGVEYAKGASGRPYYFLSSSGLMKKDPLQDTATGDYNAMQKWGIDRPAWPAQAEKGSAGNLNASFAPYSYAYTLQNPITGHQGNPSQYMEEALWVDTDPGGSQIVVKVRANSPQNGPSYSYFDPQLGRQPRIVLYRAGGSFSDSYYRKVATLTATTNDEEVTFTDNVADADIASNPQMEIDNDAPVTAALPVPFYATISDSTVLTAGDTITGRVEVELSVTSGLFPGSESITEPLYPGTTIQVGLGTENEEFCTVISISSDVPPYKIVTVFQNSHSNGESVQTSSRANMPCRFSCVAFDSIFLAGDKWNPDTLYKSKTGEPRSFPAVMDLAANAPGSIRVGTPSDPIQNICEFAGAVITLNKSHIYQVPVSNGVMQTPTKTLAQRGLYASGAWCIADNELWYLAYDGIYSWSGGISTKRSEALDPIFRGEFFDGFYPISLVGEASRDSHGLTDLDKIRFCYRNNKIYVSYIDTAGIRRRVNYSTIYDRWHADDVAPDAMLFEEDGGRLVFVKTIAGVATVNIDDSPVGAYNTESTDGWTSDQGDGADVSWEVKTGWYSMGAPAVQKQIGDVVLELNNPGSTVTVEVFYDFSDTADETFPITAEDERRRWVMPINCGKAKEIWAIQFRFTGTTGQPTTLHSLTFHWLPLEGIQAGRVTDWDNLGYQHDKRLTNLSIEYDAGSQGDVELYLDVMRGNEVPLAAVSAGDESIILAAATFELQGMNASYYDGPMRNRLSWSINLDYAVKMVRLRSEVPLQDIKIWDYHFDKIDYPPDFVAFTEWTDLGWAGEKFLRELSLEIDTGGTDTTIEVQVDGTTERTFTVNTTMDDRYRVITLNTPSDDELIGTQFRLLLTPENTWGAKAQLFNHKFHGVPEPIGVTFWDSGVQNFGANTYKFLKQVWMQYRCEVQIVVTIYVDDRSVLMTKTLPAHTQRDVERFYADLISIALVKNKSKTYRFTVESEDLTTKFYPYADGCRVEWIPFAADMRAGYSQSALSEPMERSLMP